MKADKPFTRRRGTLLAEGDHAVRAAMPPHGVHARSMLHQAATLQFVFWAALALFLLLAFFNKLS